MQHTSKLQAKLLLQLNEITTKYLHTLTIDGVLSLTLELTELTQLSLPPGLINYSYYASPGLHNVLLGLGSALRLTFYGPNRIEQIHTAYTDLQQRWHHFDPDTTQLKPQLLLICAFDPNDSMAAPWTGIPNSLLEIPAVLLQQSNQTVGITFSCRLIDGQPDPMHLAAWHSALATLSRCHWPHPLPQSSNTNHLTLVAVESEESTWLNLVSQAQQDIRARKLDKVVLSRHILVQGSHNFAPTLVTALLTERYPHCTQLAVSMGNNTLVAASPERLVQSNAGKVICEAVAGTAACGLASEPKQQTAQELLASTKSQHEHALVVDHIAEKLKNLCSNLHIPQTPEILTLRFVHHLRSSFVGQVAESTSIFDLLNHLHPTPAIGGTPTQQALDWIKTHETFSRGWYAGVMGFIDQRGDGELALILRCALLQGAQAHLFAGAGIVADSESDAELMETKIKLQTLLDVLQDV